MFSLITTFYYEKDAIRRNEFLQVIKHNVENSNLVRIYILCESGEEYIIGLHSKIEIIKQDKRPRFKDLITVANRLPDDVIKIIANTDIFFNENLHKARKLKDNQVYCLTRWDFKTNGLIEYYSNFKSQDAWIFRSKLPHTIGDYFMGLPGCDNRFAFELYQSGLKVLNPSFDIQIIHLHNTNLRNYSKVKDKVKGNYFYPLPIFLESARSKQLIRIHYLLRRKYHSEMVRGTLEGVRINTTNRWISKILEFYYKLKLQIR